MSKKTHTIDDPEQAAFLRRVNKNFWNHQKELERQREAMNAPFNWQGCIIELLAYIGACTLIGLILSWLMPSWYWAIPWVERIGM